VVLSLCIADVVDVESRTTISNISNSSYIVLVTILFMSNNDDHHHPNHASSVQRLN
jgi:hypothetical protein